MRIFALLCFILSCSRDSEPNETGIKYRPFSVSIIKITTDYDPMDTIFVEATAVTNIPLEANETDLIGITGKGVFILKLINDRPNTASLVLNNEYYNLFIVPNDTTEVIITPMKDSVQIRFSGKFDEINAYYFYKKKELDYVDIRFPISKTLKSSSKYNLIKSQVDSTTNKEMQFLKEYTKNKKLPDWFIQYERSEIIYAGACFKSQLPVYNCAFNSFNDTIPKDYFKFVDEQKLNDSNALYSSNYLWFLDSYFLKDLPYNQTIKLSGYEKSSEIRSHILNKSKHLLSGEVKSVYYKYLLSGLIPFLTDSTKIDSVAARFGVTDYLDIIKLSGLKSQSIIEDYKLSVGDQIPDFYLIDEKDSLISIRSFNNSLVYINFWATWCGPCVKNIENLNQMIFHYSKNDKIRFVNICIESDQNKWKATIKKHRLHGINLYANGAWSRKLRAFFSIKGIPHYILVDPGNILLENKTAQAPHAYDNLNKLLKKYPK